MGLFSIALPKDFGNKKATWTIVANGLTNTVTLHTQADYIVEPFGDAANKNTPPALKFRPTVRRSRGRRRPSPRSTRPRSGLRLPSRCGRPTKARRSTSPSRAGAAAGQRRARRRGRRGGPATPAEFQPPPPLALTWSVYRAAAAGGVKFDNPKPAIDKADGKATVQATFSAPGEYMLRVEGNDSTGVGGGGFQCCWTNAHVSVTVKPAAGTGG